MLSGVERRLGAEWDLLQHLVALNPDRITNPSTQDLAFALWLRQTPALPINAESASVQTDHAVSLVFPRYFPAAPLELYLATPVQHPNVHPETGFVCLWDRHRVSHNVEHALHKLVAILGWRLYNCEATHVMQPAALVRLHTSGKEIAASLAAPPLLGVPSDGSAGWPLPTEDRLLRRRLS